MSENRKASQTPARSRRTAYPAPRAETLPEEDRYDDVDLPDLPESDLPALQMHLREIGEWTSH